METDKIEIEVSDEHRILMEKEGSFDGYAGLDAQCSDPIYLVAYYSAKNI